MTPWITAGVLLVVILAFYIFLPSRQRLRDDYVQRQSEEHEAMVAMMREWLDNERIFRAIMTGDRHGGAPDASAAILETIYKDVGEMPEVRVRATLALLLRRRTTRRVIARYMEQEHGVPPFECRRALLEWATYKEPKEAA